MSLCIGDTPNLPAEGISEICTNRSNGTTCVGDSGGFLGFYRQDPDYTWVVEGVTSYGASPEADPICSGDNDVFSSVSYYNNWIQETAQENMDKTCE